MCYRSLNFHVQTRNQNSAGDFAFTTVLRMQILLMRASVGQLSTHHCSGRWVQQKLWTSLFKVVQCTALELKSKLFSDKQGSDVLVCSFHLAKLYHTILRDKRLRETNRTAAEQQFLHVKEIPLVKSKYSLTNIQNGIFIIAFVVVYFFNCCHPEKLVN